jgi:hypothetical protein
VWWGGVWLLRSKPRSETPLAGPLLTLTQQLSVRKHRCVETLGESQPGLVRFPRWRSRGGERPLLDHPGDRKATITTGMCCTPIKSLITSQLMRRETLVTQSRSLRSRDYPAGPGRAMRSSSDGYGHGQGRHGGAYRSGDGDPR